MQAHELDDTYTALAQAIGRAGPKSELYLAMLCLKLITLQPDAGLVKTTVNSTLDDLLAHETSHESSAV